MADTSDIVAAAMAEAGGDVEVPEVVEETVETSETVETETPVVEEESPDAVEEVDDGTDEKKEEKPVTQEQADDVVKFLTDHGLKGLALNDKMPTKRARKIVYNALKKLVEGHGGELKKRDDELGSLRTRAGYADAWDKLVMQPEVAIARLAAANPAWAPIAERLKQAVADNKGKADVPTAENDPEPQPDIKYSEAQGGGEGYSPDQWKKYQQWIKRDAVRAAKAEVESTLKPIRDREQAAQSDTDRRAALTAEVHELTDVYGDEFTAAQPEILKFLRENDAQGRHYSLTQAAQRVMARLRQKSDDEKKAQWMEEMKKAPSAAKKTPGGSTTTKRVSQANKLPENATTEDIVTAALKESGMIK